MSLNIASLFRVGRPPQCPRCASIEFRAVGARNGWERLMRSVLLPFRCDFCGHHFYLANWQLTAQNRIDQELLAAEHS